MQPKYSFGPDYNPTDKQKLDEILNQASEKLLESLSILLVELVNLNDAQRLTTMQQAVGQLFKRASEDFGKARPNAPEQNDN